MRLDYSDNVPDQPTLWPITEPALRFVLRRHHATRLHWDLRIEACGRLFSWCMAAPPRLDPTRPVRMVLQPPHDPRHMLSERRIPHGFSGAGPTLPEEFGWARPLRIGRFSQPKSFHEAFLTGRIDLYLEGEILKGLFRIELSREGWWISKKKDEFASQVQPVWPGRSFFTGKELKDL